MVSFGVEDTARREGAAFVIDLGLWSDDRLPGMRGENFLKIFFIQTFDLGRLRQIFKPCFSPIPLTILTRRARISFQQVLERDSVAWEPKGGRVGRANESLELARLDPTSLKGRLLRAARQHFARAGFQAASMRAVAAEVGVDVSTLYYHYENKQSLFEATLLDLQRDFESGLKDWIQACRDELPERFLALALLHLGPALLDQDAVRVMQHAWFDEDFAGREWATGSQRQLIQTLRVFCERRLGVARLPADFDAAVLALFTTVLTMIGSRRQISAILGVESESREYRELVLKSLGRMIGAYLSSLRMSPVTAHSVNPEDSSL